MKYKLYSDINKPTVTPGENLLSFFLQSRGVPESEIESWVEGKSDNICDYHLLDYIDEAVELVHDTIMANKKIFLVVDSDADGFTSSAIFINYLYDIYGDDFFKNLTYFLHEGKQHGLGDVEVPDGFDLVVCPDSSSNDYEFHKSLFDRGMKVLILDHHQAPHISEYAVTVNNQLCAYPNKNLCGAGVVWQFCRAYQDKYGTKDSNPEKYADLCAIGLVGDMMDYRSLETRTLVFEGLNDIHNPFIYKMTGRNQYGINNMGGVNHRSMAFYVVPFINAIVRSGKMEEKDLIFKSMLNATAFTRILSGKRGEKGKMVPLIDEAIRVAGNVKDSRQTKAQNQGMELLEYKIENENLLNNAILLFKCEPGQIDRNIAGLVANKMQAKYQHPCLVLTKNENENGEAIYSGSARNFSFSKIENFRTLCEKTNLVEYAQGHEGAFGIAIKEENIPTFIQKTNEIYGEGSSEPVYFIDFAWTEEEANANLVMALSNFTEYYGQDIPPALVAITDVKLSEETVYYAGEGRKARIQIKLPSGVELIKFGVTEEEYENLVSGDKIGTFIGTPAINDFNGVVTAQVKIDHYETRTEWVF